MPRPTKQGRTGGGSFTVLDIGSSKIACFIAEADAAAEDAEAKRLFYVACTRAKQALVLSGRAALAQDPAGASLFDRVRRTLAALGTPVPPQAGEYALALAGAPIAVTVAVAEPPQPDLAQAPTCERPDAASAQAATAEAASAATTAAVAQTTTTALLVGLIAALWPLRRIAALDAATAFRETR